MLSPLSPQDTGGSIPSTSSSTMNTSYATSTASYPTSAMSDEGRGWPPRKHGQSLKSPASAVSESTPAKLRIVSPASVAPAKLPTSRGKIHKRGSSASSITTPKTAAFPAFDPEYQDVASPQSLYQDAYNPSSPSTSIREKVKIKPLLRKLQPQEKTSLDLSRSAAENEGLGIYTSSGGRERRGGSDVGYNASSAKRGLHTRTTSGTSQISTTTTSSNHRSGTQYVHPMRQNPRPFTPPLSNSYQNSLANSELSYSKVDGPPEEDQHQGQQRSQRIPYSSIPSSYAPLPTLKRTPPPLHIRTHSSARLTSSSQTNLPGTPSSLRYGDNFGPADPIPSMPHTARSSLDSAFRSKKSRSNTNTDPAAQLAAVQALRAEFNAREAAKEMKLQEVEARIQQKEARRKEKRDESQRRRSEAQDGRRAKSNATSEKSVPLSMEYSQTTTVPMDIDLEAGVSSRPRRTRTTTAGSATKAVSSQWSLFWFKFKTMWLKFKRSISRSS